MNTKQTSIDKLRVNIYLPITDLSKLRMLIRGKTVTEPKKLSNHKMGTAVRMKTVSDQLTEMIHELVKDIKEDADALEWNLGQRQRQIELRRQADEAVSAGLNRKPKSEWLKPGRKPKAVEAAGRVDSKKAVVKTAIQVGKKTNEKVKAKGRK